MVPNRERYAYALDNEIINKATVKILTISKDESNWEQIFDCPNIEELTLHNPSNEQVEKIQQLKSLKRLRVTFFRASDIEFIGDLDNLEEVVLEYVSGFSDLSPLKKLTKLKSLHFENLRKVSNFDGLEGIFSLKYLHINGTLDWKQPIDNFAFLKGLPNLEVFSLGFSVVSKAKFPALLPLLALKNLKRMAIVSNSFPTNEYAFLQVALPEIEGCDWDLCWDYQDRFEFLGKKAGYVNKSNPNAKARCDEFVELYNEMKKEAEEILKNRFASN